MRILITGGSGFIGSHLTDRLVALGHKVRIFDRADPAYPNTGAEYMKGDIRENMDHVFDAPFDVVFHLAAEVGSGLSMADPALFLAANSYGTANLIESMRRKDSLCRLIVASSATVYGEATYSCPKHGAFFPDLRPVSDLEKGMWELPCPQCGNNADAIAIGEDRPLNPASVYGLSKLDTEKTALLLGRTWGFPAIAFRPFAVYGPRQSLGNPYTGVLALFATRVFAGQPIMHYEDGGQNKSYLYIDDAIDLFVESMTNERAVGGAYNMGTEWPVTIRQVAQFLVDEIKPGLDVICTSKFRSSDTRHMWPSLDLTQSVFEWRPQVRFEEGVRRMLAWLGSLPEQRIHDAMSNFSNAEKYAAKFGLEV
jgi:dTDP-L-rhamnose 4-epimerase